MNFKLPWWFFLVLALVVLGGSMAAGYWMGTRGGDEQIQLIRERAAADSAAWDSVRAVLDDSLATLVVTNREIGQRVDTVRIRIPVAVRHAEAAGESLAEHLNAQGDTAGLRLYDAEEAADSIVLALRISEISLLDLRIENFELQIGVQDSIITDCDAALVRLRADLGEALAEGDRLHRKANPPFTVRLLNDGWKFAAGVAGGYLIGKS